MSKKNQNRKKNEKIHMDSHKSTDKLDSKKDYVD